MKSTISATDFVRQLGDILGRIRFRGESFVIERHGTPVARIGPVPAASSASVQDVLRAWRGASSSEPEFASDLERVNAADHPPGDPWDS